MNELAKQEIIPVEQGSLGLVVNSRTLHQNLKIQTRYDMWIGRRIDEYKFLENRDFEICSNLGISQPSKYKGGRNRTDIVVTLDMAKELAMLENNEVGRMIRYYFIEIEKRYRDWIGFILPKLETDFDLFGQRDGYNYLQLLRSCRCSVSSGAVGSRIRKNKREFWKNLNGDWFVSEIFGKTIITNAIARQLNIEAKQKRLIELVAEVQELTKELT